MTITNKDKVFLLLIRRSMFGSSEQLCDISLSNDEINWKEILDESVSHAMVIAALEGTVGLENINIPEDIMTEWQGLSLKFILKNEKLMSVQKKVIDLLKKEGIEGSILKGSFSSACYDRPELRILGDVDYLVLEKDYSRAMEVLESSGFQKEKVSTNVCHTEFFYGNCIIEIHRFINGLPVGKSGEYIRGIFDEALEKKDFYFEEMQGYTFPVFNDICNALVLMLHTQNHMLNGGLGLRHLCDWAAFVKKKATPEFESEFMPVLERLGLLKFYNVLSDTCRKYLIAEKATLEGSLVDSTDICDILMLDFISNGNFGRKSPETLHGSSVFTKTTVVETKDGTKSKVKLGKNIKYFLNHAMPVTQKHPILLPVAFVYVPIRYIFRVIKGERTMLSPKFISQTAKRNDLYQSLELFNSDEK